MNVSMNVSSVYGAASSPAATQGVGKDGAHRMQGALDAAAQLFGMTSQELKDALGSGQSMVAVAADKGVSTDDLMTALTQAIKAARPSGAQGPGDAVIERIADRIANQTGPIAGVGHWGHHHATGTGSGGTPPTPSSGEKTSSLRTVDTYL